MNSFNGTGRLIAKNYIETSGVLKLVVAIKSNMKDKPDNKIPCVAFGKTAEIINNYCKVGHPFNIENGTLTSSDYEKEGRNLVSYEVIINKVDFATLPPKSTMENETKEIKPEGKLSKARVETPNTEQEGSEDFEDDIPF